MLNGSGKLLRIALAACGAAAVSTAAFAQPANDDCANAIVVTNNSSTFGDSTGASGFDESSCAGTGDVNDVWYQFTAPGTAVFIFDTEGSGFDTTLSLFQGCGGAQIACDDDGGTGLLSRIATSLTNGQVVYVRVAGYAGAVGSFTLNISGGNPPPSNDECAGATPLAAGSSVFGSNNGATGTDITSCAFNDFTDLWYSFNPPITGGYQFDTEGSSFDTTLSVFDFCGGTQLACDDDSGTGLLSLVQVSLTQGQTVYVRIAGYNGLTGNFSLNAAGGTPPPPPPANDNCGTATPITLPLDTSIDIAGATPDLDVDCNAATAFETANGVWYSFTPAGNQRVSFSETGPLDVVLALFQGSCAGLSPVACTNAPEILIADLTGGTTYYLLVGANAAAGFPIPPAQITLSFTEVIVPAGDNCASPLALTAGSSVFGSNVGAIGTDLTSCAFNDTTDIWYSFTAPISAEYEFNTEGSSFDTTLSVFDFCNGSELACDDDAGTGLLSLLFVNLSQGQTVLVRVAGYNGQTGDYTLTAAGGTPPPPPPANDDCGTAAVISGNPFNASVAVGGALNDLDTSCNAAAAFETRSGIWYTYTPTENGTMVIAEASTNDVVIATFVGGCFGLSEVACSAADTTPAIQLQAGQQYHFLIGMFSDSASARNTYDLTFTFTAAPGACCIGGNCIIVNGATDCASQGGTWQGAGVDCGGLPLNNNTTQVAIPDYDGAFVQVATSTAQVSGVVGTVSSVRVFVGVAHTWAGDLAIRLRSPDNRVADLMIRPGTASCTAGELGNGTDVNGTYVFTDSATQTLDAAVLSNVLPPSGTYLASTCFGGQVSLNTVFAGAQANGTWTLEISDEDEAIVGNLNSFGIVVNNTGATPTPCSGGGGNGACCAGSTCSVVAQAACTGTAQFAGAGTVCNAAGNFTTPCCLADTNGVGGVTLQDLFDYLTLWFGQAPGADINGGGVTLQDLFDYLSAWFGGCP